MQMITILINIVARVVSFVQVDILGVQQLRLNKWFLYWTQRIVGPTISGV